MVVRIRLARFGKRNAPFYNVVIAQARTARNSRPMEVIGTYDPVPKAAPGSFTKPQKHIQLDLARAKYWLGVGAQPSDPVYRLLALAGLVEPKHYSTEAAQGESSHPSGTATTIEDAAS